MLSWAFTKIAINISWQWTILECIRVLVVSGEGVDLKLVHFAVDEVVERAVLSARLALVPVINFSEAHASCELFSLNTVDHALVEGIAGMGL